MWDLVGLLFGGWMTYILIKSGYPYLLSLRKESPLYLECHITIDPVFGEDRVEVYNLADLCKFRLADLVMKKGSDDPGVPHKEDTFMTGHGHNRKDLEKRMKDLIFLLQGQGFAVRRYKIEEVVLDSRKKDELGLL